MIDKEEADRVLASFKACATESNSNWNKRYRENVARIKSGNIYEVVHVVKT